MRNSQLNKTDILQLHMLAVNQHPITIIGDKSVDMIHQIRVALCGRHADIVDVNKLIHGDVTRWKNFPDVAIINNIDLEEINPNILSEFKTLLNQRISADTRDAQSMLIFLIYDTKNMDWLTNRTMQIDYSTLLITQR
jgi:hypothetical protein